jgi:hypothetical protein
MGRQEKGEIIGINEKTRDSTIPVALEESIEDCGEMVCLLLDRGDRRQSWRDHFHCTQIESHHLSLVSYDEVCVMT